VRHSAEIAHVAYGDSRRRPSPPRPAPDAGPLLAAAQQHLKAAGVSACVVRSPDGQLLVAVGSPADRLFALLGSHVPRTGDDVS
jgi:hypothetical protein